MGDIRVIKRAIRTGTAEGLSDAFEMCRALSKEGAVHVLGTAPVWSEGPEAPIAHELANEIRRECIRMMRGGGRDVPKLLETIKRCLLFNARDDFDCYCQYIEWNREPNKKFYIPRRNALKRCVDALQRLEDGKLRLLTISMPPGVGKTTIAVFFLTWQAGKYPELPILTGSHSNSFLRGVYDECLRIMDPGGEYLWHEVFPETSVVKTDAKDMRIDVGTSKRFQTLEFSSIGSGNAGKVRAMNLLYCDDLVEGIEQAMSIERLEKLWQGYTTDLRQRKQGDRCKELHIATRWSVHDPIGKLEEKYGDNEDCEFIRMPAIDEDGHSNFEYPYGLGFDDTFYREQMEIMDDASWRALYMNEPIEREGQLYPADQFRRWYKLPEGEPEMVLAVCDTKDKGTDYCAMPVGVRYPDDDGWYMVNAFYENYAPQMVEDNLVEFMVANGIDKARFESNAAGGRIAGDIAKRLEERGCNTVITTKFNTANKETKILVHAAWIKKNCIFPSDDVLKQSDMREFRRFFNALTRYTLSGKNKNDDAPDSMAEFSDFAQGGVANKVFVVNRRQFGI